MKCVRTEKTIQVRGAPGLKLRNTDLNYKSVLKMTDVAFCCYSPAELFFPADSVAPRESVQSSALVDSLTFFSVGD